MASCLSTGTPATTKNNNKKMKKMKKEKKKRERFRSVQSCIQTCIGNILESTNSTKLMLNTDNTARGASRRLRAVD